MSDTSAALRAAREVQADVLAPELYRQANEFFLRARKEYKFKNFELAREHAYKARRLAEQAEFEVIKAGGTRQEGPADQAVVPTPSASPYDYDSPKTVRASDILEQREGVPAPGGAPAPQPNGAGGPPPTQQ